MFLCTVTLLVSSNNMFRFFITTFWKARFVPYITSFLVSCCYSLWEMPCYGGLFGIPVVILSYCHILEFLLTLRFGLLYLCFWIACHRIFGNLACCSFTSSLGTLLPGCCDANRPFSRSVSRRVLLYNLSYGNEFYSHVFCLENQTHFHSKSCAPRLVLKQLGNGYLFAVLY